VRFASPLVVTPIWARLATGDKPYTVVFLPPGAHGAKAVLLVLGVFPACIGIYIACCSLPCFLSELASGEALVEVPRKKVNPPSEQEVTTSSEAHDPEGGQEASGPQGAQAIHSQIDAKKDSESGKEASGQAIQSQTDAKKETLKIDMGDGPAYKLRDSWFPTASLALFTQISLLLFIAAQLCFALYSHILLVSSEPYMVALVTSESFLCLAFCTAVTTGSRAMQKNPFFEDGATCPKKLEVETLEDLGMSTEKKANEHDPLEMRRVLSRYIRYWTVLPFVPTLILVYCAIGHALKEVYVVTEEWHRSRNDSVPGPDVLGHCYHEIDLLNYHCVVYILFFKFMLDEALLVRTVRAHVEALACKIHTVYKQEKQEVDEKRKDCFDTQAMEDLHQMVVNLARVILPCLGPISGPAMGFAVFNWAWAFLRIFHHLAAATDDEMLFGLANAVGRVLAVHLPLGLLCLLPLAAVSDACDSLQQRFNDLRSVGIPDDDKHIRLTESYMQGANRGQGLGYELYGTRMIVNKRMLLALFAKIVGYASVIFGISYQFFKLQREYQAVLKHKKD